MALEGDVRVGLCEGCCKLRVCDKMSQKEKDEALLIESEEAGNEEPIQKR